MRTLPITIAAALAVAGSAAAQTFPFEIYPGVTSFTSRGNIGTGTGEVHQGFHTAVNRGLGNTAGVCAVHGVTMLLQDQNASTQGMFGITIRSGTDATGPDGTAGGVIAATGPTLGYPVSTLTTPIAWILTVNFTTPVAIPCESFFSVGVELPPAAGWSATDGESVHASNNVANAQHANSVDMAWQIIGGAVTHPSVKRSWRIAPRFPIAFQAGNTDATAPLSHFGNGGYYPNTALVGAASQGLAFKCSHVGGVAATAYVFGSVLGFNPVAFTVPGIGNTGYIDLTGLIPFALAVGPADGSVIPFLANGVDALPSAAGGMIGCQAIILNPASTGVTLDFSNAVGVVLL